MDYNKSFISFYWGKTFFPFPKLQTGYGACHLSVQWVPLTEKAAGF
jgi:hypothetical protein